MKLGYPIEDDISRSVEASIYEGVDSPLILQREYLVVFNCDFDLQVRHLHQKLLLHLDLHEKLSTIA